MKLKNIVFTEVCRLLQITNNIKSTQAVYDNISAEPDTFNHEPNYKELKNKNNEMESFMMPREAMR